MVIDLQEMVKNPAPPPKPSNPLEGNKFAKFGEHSSDEDLSNLAAFFRSTGQFGKLGKVEQRDVVQELLEMASATPRTGGIETVLFHPSFPVDVRHNAKIFREKLALWAQKRLR